MAEYPLERNPLRIGDGISSRSWLWKFVFP